VIEANSIDDLEYESETSTVSGSGEAIVATMVCPDCDAILGFATGGAMV
jgi:hypothetical protein